MMSREILFRGKREDNGEWVEGQLLNFKAGVGTEEVALILESCEWDNSNKWFNLRKRAKVFPSAKVLPSTVGQYTGLTDKNGKKIFEGDIFKFDDEVWESYYTSCGTEYDSFKVENYGIVGFDEDTARFDFIKYKFHENSVEADLHENHTIEFSDFVSSLEVIGNIYDNPELMKVCNVG